MIRIQTESFNTLTVGASRDWALAKVVKPEIRKKIASVVIIRIARIFYSYEFF